MENQEISVKFKCSNYFSGWNALSDAQNVTFTATCPQKVRQTVQAFKSLRLSICVSFPCPALLLFQSGYVLPGASLLGLQLQKQTKPFKPNVKGYEEEGKVSKVWAKSEIQAFTPKEGFKLNMTLGKINLPFPFLS